MITNVLFLCTANYYRSRFAELLFNHHCGRRQLNCRADSRGIATEFGADNVGPISTFTLDALRERGIGLGDDIQLPRQLEESDLARADLIIALHEVEHRPYLQQRFPKWVDRIEYWHVPDLEGRAAADALLSIEAEVERLLRRLAGPSARA